MAEAKKAAGALLDRDRDGTLDLRELRGRVDAKEFAAADRDKDGTLTKDEYFTIVEKRKALQGRRRPQNCAPRRAARCCAAGVLERMPVQMNRDASRFSRWRISFFGKPASTFPGYALGRTGATV
jgi:EF hand domain-containing protein